MSVTLTETVLRSKSAQDAIAEGIATALLTGDLQRGWNVMITRGKKNGSYLALKIAIIVDSIKALRG